MGFLSSLFGTEKENPLNVRKAIIAFSSGNMVELAFSNIKAFINTYQENPTKALKARLYSAAMMRVGINLNQNGIPDIDAKFYKLDNQFSILRFNFKEYGGVFELEENTPMVAPSFIAIVYNNDFIGEPAIFALEPSFEVGSTMLIRLMPEGNRMNLGKGSNNDEQSFLKLVVQNLGSFKEEKKSKPDDLQNAEDVLFDEFGLRLDKTPDPKSIEELFLSMCTGLSNTAKASLLFRLVVMNFLGAAKLMRDQGEEIELEKLSWLTDVVNSSIDYSEASEDQIELETLTSQLNQNIMAFFDSFGIKNGT